MGASKGGLEKVPRGYEPRKAPTVPGVAPAISAEPPVAAGMAGSTAAATLAIVGLNPAKTIDVPAPPASRAAGFSAGPETRPEGGTGTNGAGLLNVPGLVVKGGAKDAQPTLVATFSPTSRENLLAAARVRRRPEGNRPWKRMRRGWPKRPIRGWRAGWSTPSRFRCRTSPATRGVGWCGSPSASRCRASGRRRCARRVLRKVDPKYVAAAAAERVEGTVRLFAVIRKDGHVGGITLIRQLDDRLDRSAQEALAKWEFTPARAQRGPGGRGRGLRDSVPPGSEGSEMMEERQNLIVDADDTLWENNIYFERAFEEFVAFLAHSSL